MTPTSMTPAWIDRRTIGFIIPQIVKMPIDDTLIHAVRDDLFDPVDVCLDSPCHAIARKLLRSTGNEWPLGERGIINAFG